MHHARASHPQRDMDRDWRDDSVADHAIDPHVNNHPNHRVDPDNDDEEE